MKIVCDEFVMLCAMINSCIVFISNLSTFLVQKIWYS